MSPIPVEAAESSTEDLILYFGGRREQRTDDLGGGSTINSRPYIRLARTSHLIIVTDTESESSLPDIRLSSMAYPEMSPLPEIVQHRLRNGPRYAAHYRSYRPRVVCGEAVMPRPMRGVPSSPVPR